MKTIFASVAAIVLSFASVSAAIIDVDATATAVANTPAPTSFASLEAALRA